MANLRELKKDFSLLIESIPNNLEKLKNILSIKEFQFNEKEIDKVENWLKTTIVENKTEEEINEIKRIFFSYCSTAFIRSNGGEIILDTKKNSFTYGEPIIINYGGKGYPWVGISIYAWIKRREEGRPYSKLNQLILRNLKNKSG